MRTTTSMGREIFGSVTFSYFTNSFAVSFSSNACRTAAFIDVSPEQNFSFEVAVRIRGLLRSEQELCHGTNMLMSLIFSSARDGSFGPRRSNHDCKTVPRRNSFGGHREPSEPREQIWIFSRLDYDEQDSRQPTTTSEPALITRKSPSHRSGRTCDAACQPARRKCVDEARTTRRPAGRAFVGRYLRQLDALHFARPRHVAPAFARIRQPGRPSPGAAALLACARPCARRDAHAASADRRVQFHDRLRDGRRTAARYHIRLQLQRRFGRRLHSCGRRLDGERLRHQRARYGGL